MTHFIATYRLQFRPEFGFADAAAVVPYLAALGISHIYASPVFAARPGSPHGYDGVDPNRLNPELGAPEEWDALVRRRHTVGMGWLQDIVPNHVAFHAGNRMLADVLEMGRASPYRAFFDIDWHHPADDLQGKVMAPFLGTRFREALQNGDIRVVFNAGGFAARVYGESTFPLAIAAYRRILGNPSAEASPTGDDPDFARLDDTLQALERLDRLEDPDVRRGQAQALKNTLRDLYRHNAGIRRHVDSRLARLNGEPGDPQRLQELDRLLSRQYFRLCWWQRANRTINYRRFFDINELIALRQEDPTVFARTHGLIAALTAEGSVSGVRIDHVDGLADPAGYLDGLRRRLGDDPLILVEKILSPEEELPSNWPVQGTTGYDFTHWLNGLFVKRENEAHLSDIYRAYTGRQTSFEAEVRQAKREILANRLAGDLANLVRRVRTAAAGIERPDTPTPHRLSETLTELLVRLPVYRTYLDAGAVREPDRETVTVAAAQVLDAQPHLGDAMAFIRELLLGDGHAGPSAGPPPDRRLAVVRAFQQLSSALMAKGCEDTAFYRYHRLISLNEVGGDPGRFGCRRAQFHAFMARRAAWPRTMNGTATHDSKRGEDLRARLNVLSEIPDLWRRRLRHWHELTRNFRTRVNGEMIPDRNTVYLLFQTLLGAWSADDHHRAPFEERIQAYMRKAVREAGQATSWVAPREPYEAALERFVTAILDAAPDNLFWTDFVPFCRRVAFFGYFNALSQCLIKIAAPGVPDFYQGSELWQLALVDPDNRRPVAYAAREHALKALDLPGKDDRAQAAELLRTAADGRIKLFLIRRGLMARQRHPHLFLSGHYRPLAAKGAFAAHVVSFAREAGGRWAVVLVPRFLTSLVEEDEAPLGRGVWQDTTIRLPSEAPSTWRDVFTHQTVQGAGALAVGEVLSHFPAALLISEVGS